MIDHVKRSPLLESNCNEEKISESTDTGSNEDLNKTLEAMIEPLKVLTLKKYTNDKYIIIYLPVYAPHLIFYIICF